jgi:hypothetical protein
MATSYKFTDHVALLGTIDPDANATGAFSTDYADSEYFESFGALVSAGIIASSGTVDFKLRQATSATGASVKDITGLSITQLDTGDNDKQAWINVRADQLDLANSFRFVVAVMTLTTAGSDSAAYLFGMHPKHGPASGHDLATVAEIV